MRAHAQRVCAPIGLPIAKLCYTLVPNSSEIRDDQALKQLISDIVDMSVLCTLLNDGALWHPKTIGSIVHGGIHRVRRALE